MSAASVARLKEKVEQGVAISLSVYEDRNGLWAKDTEYVDRVRVKFEDAETLFLTMEEVRSLPQTIKDRINHAPSSEPI